MENEMTWQPIETAPIDGTPVLLGWDDGDHIPCVGYFSQDKFAKNPRPYWKTDRERAWGTRHLRANQPTHWMPLPAPPTGQQQGGAA